MAFNLSKFSMRDREGQTISTGFMGTTNYALWELLEEHYNPARHDITGIFKAVRYDDYTNEMTECVVMICEQLNPGLLDNSEQNMEEDQSLHESSSSCSTRYWENRVIFDTCFNPYDNGNFIENCAEVQNHSGVFPGGYRHLFAATVPSGSRPISKLMEDGWDVDYFVAIRLELSKLLLFDNNGNSSTAAASSGDDFFFNDLTEDKIWFSPENRHVWVADNTLSGWYAHQSEAGQRMKRQRQPEKRIRGGSNNSTEPQKKFEEFWAGFVKRWLRLAQLTENDVNMEKISPFQQQLCLRHRDSSSNNANGHGLSAFSDSSTVPSPASDKEWIMVGDGN
ncbi:hypothetical protein DPV78_007870 [Talaromyces pinophilus]|nr:hypothetical protein DPV78_007870 [Talaromyces pinophilus]